MIVGYISHMIAANAQTSLRINTVSQEPFCSTVRTNNVPKCQHLAYYIAECTPFQGGASFVDHLCCICLVLLYFHARLFVDAMWSPAGKELTSWLSLVISNCDVVTFQFVSWVRCGA